MLHGLCSTFMIVLNTREVDAWNANKLLSPDIALNSTMNSATGSMTTRSRRPPAHSSGGN